MADIRKTITGLECCLNTSEFEECTENCPYCQRELVVGVCSENLMRDALELLKAQEPKKAEWTTKRTQEHDGEWYCSVCGYEPIVMSDDMKFCPGCGAKMVMPGRK